MQNHDAKNTVTVRIWTSKFNPNHPGENIGHVSIQTTAYYISLWPEQAHSPHREAAKEREGLGIFAGIAHEFFPNLEMDMKYENQRTPDYVEYFYSLDIEKINLKFENLKKTITGWTLIPGLCENTMSCASLAWDILTAGNIKKLLSRTTSIEVSSTGIMNGSTSILYYFFAPFFKNQKTPNQTSIDGSMYSMEMASSLIVNSPDSLVEYLKKAKQAEQQLMISSKSTVSMLKYHV